MNDSVSGIGASVLRREDFRFIKGQGKYVDDMVLPRQTYAAIVRSTHAHATINSINSSDAAGMPGVIRVLTSVDFEAFGGVPCGWLVNSQNGDPMVEPKHPILAEGKVRHVGDPIAVVIASTRGQARDAADAVVVDYTALPAVVSMRQAIDSPPAAVHDDAANNVCYDWAIGDKAEVDAAFAGAAHVTTLEFTNNRVSPNAMEPRCAIGDYDTSNGDYTLYTTSQNPHVIRLLMGAFVLSIPEHKLRVYSPDVGGGFGSKIYHYAEEAIVTVAAKVLGRPVKWTSDRTEAFISDAHGRDHVTTAELAMDADGKFLGLRCDTLANMGAYLSTFAPCVPTYLHATLLAGQYKTPLIYCNVKAVFTNTVPVDAYRGAGRPEATYLLERVIDKAAREMKLDPAEIRRRNFIQPEDFPYQMPVALVYDIGDYEATLSAALKASDWDGFAARKAEAKARGKLRGIGLSCYIEACGIAPSAVVGSLGARAGLYEAATIRVNPTGSISVLTGSHSLHGDTARIPFGMGTYGSRSIAVGGTAIVKAVDKIIAKGKKIAAHLMEASADDVVFEGGMFKVEGTDKEIDFGSVALTAYVPHNYPLDEIEPGLEETAFYDPANFTFPAGSYVCEVEIDPETGVVEVCSMHASDDFGNIINPMVVEGQVHGGLVQGIGQALLEQAVYDDNGQLLTASYNDYTMPRADDMPNFTVDHQITACTHNPLGVKGCGEAGAIGSPPAVINAIVDALQHLGVDHMEMPATPRKVWRAIHEAKN